MTFQIGDRVVALRAFDGNDDIVGITGTVRTIDDFVGVEFDVFINGHSVDSGCEYGYGWCCSEDVLKKIEDQELPEISDVEYLKIIE